ncbi:MAG: amino acid permease [Nocardia sp.]|nr:amino acid permease [Nocardia sp.]
MSPAHRPVELSALAAALHLEQSGYRRTLRNRQLQMIAIGGVIGTGLFLGAGGRLASAGPGLFLVYAVCAVFVFFVLRALGELVLYRPLSGSFVSYSREFYGEKLAFVVGWMYFFHWGMTGIADITAIATYMRYWHIFTAVPQWLLALVALCLVVVANLISVRWFGEVEFWVALVKVIALVGFLVVGLTFLLGRLTIHGHNTGPAVIAHHGGLFPTGALSLVAVTTGVVFAYAAVELVGVAAGETEDPRRTVPRAITSVLVRIVVFYAGSVLLLGLLLPYNVFRDTESPFVTFFSRIGVPAAGSVMNLIVLTAAFSSLNAGLYSTGRILRSLSMNGSAPAKAARMSGSGVPYVGILATGLITLIGVGLVAVVPDRAFDIVLNVSALGTIGSWAAILLCQLRLWRRWYDGISHRPRYRMPGSPYTGIATLVFLAGVIVLMVVGADPVQRYAVVATVVIMGPVLVGGWFLCRRKVLRIAAIRCDHSGQFPVVAERPLPGPGTEPQVIITDPRPHTE